MLLHLATLCSTCFLRFLLLHFLTLLCILLHSARHILRHRLEVVNLKLRKESGSQMDREIRSVDWVVLQSELH